jgi:hypothetical protein
LAKVVVVIESEGNAAAWTTRLRARFVVTGVASESVAETVKLYVPFCEGVPASAPEVLKVKPVGKVPEARLHL